MLLAAETCYLYDCLQDLLLLVLLLELPVRGCLDYSLSEASKETSLGLVVQEQKAFGSSKTA